ncbi:cis-2,3-dihydrobiphenyl-2,3-diol dehydrogenase [compost metagenome]
MNGRLTDKVAIVTGGTRGIGRAIAGRFLAEGARVVVAGRSEPGAHGVDGGALFFRADVASAGDVQALVDFDHRPGRPHRGTQGSGSACHRQRGRGCPCGAARTGLRRVPRYSERPGLQRREHSLSETAAPSRQGTEQALARYRRFRSFPMGVRWSPADILFRPPVECRAASNMLSSHRPSAPFPVQPSPARRST